MLNRHVAADPVVTFDRMREAANLLGGRLVQLERQARAEGRTDDAEKYRRRHFEISDVADAVDPADLDEQIAACDRFTSEYRSLTPTLTR